ncbi:alpha/beta hydrolase family protein [Amycolatopsis sp. NPDC051903]|uniref:alpha/beta hydrolase family protein n=1 Tax=Amycolatopsis sp. NPDC051903 TaxID=3363936 RepID=UPI00379EB5F6
MNLGGVVRYGPEPSQFAELWPGSGPARGLAVLLHGGWWRARHGLDQLNPLCAVLVGRGWAVANVEYRRVDGDTGGWPATVTDVLEAVRTARSWHARPGPAVAIGHSAGGHLALLAAAESAVDAAVGLAPITDLPRCAEAGLGEGATPLFLGAAGPAAARDASPRFRLPLGRPHLVVHGDRDERVPVEHSRDYVAAARAAGDEVDYAELPGAGHFAVTDPGHRAWSDVRTWLEKRFP